MFTLLGTELDEGSSLCWSEEKLNHVLKTDSNKLFKDLHWQVKYFLSKIYLEILRWSFVWIGDCYGNSLVEN